MKYRVTCDLWTTGVRPRPLRGAKLIVEISICRGRNPDGRICQAASYAASEILGSSVQVRKGFMRYEKIEPSKPLLRHESEDAVVKSQTTGYMNLILGDSEASYNQKGK